MKRIVWFFIWLTLGLLLACQAKTNSVPGLSESLPDEDAQILLDLQAELNSTEYGFAPLLLNPDTRVVVENNVAYLDYPDQPESPTDWQTLECFGYAYAVYSRLVANERVADAALGEVVLPNGLGGDNQSYHMVAWVSFSSGHTITVDLTPLSVEQVNAIYGQVHLVQDGAGLKRQFQTLRERIALNKARPLTVLQQEGRVYYLLASVLVLADEYQFVLYGHEIQPATRSQALEFKRSAVAGIRFDRPAFTQVQLDIIHSGSNLFSVRPDLLTRRGDKDEMLNNVLDEHLHLLWHLVAKFEEPD